MKKWIAALFAVLLLGAGVGLAWYGRNLRALFGMSTDALAGTAKPCDDYGCGDGKKKTKELKDFGGGSDADRAVQDEMKPCDKPPCVADEPVAPPGGRAR